MKGRLDWVLGKTVDEVVAALGKPRSTAIGYVAARGYRVVDGCYVAAPGAQEIEDSITARIAAAPPAAPCFRCGGRVCACRDLIGS